MLEDFSPLVALMLSTRSAGTEKRVAFREPAVTPRTVGLAQARAKGFESFTGFQTSE